MGLDTYGFVISRSPVRSRRVAPVFFSTASGDLILGSQFVVSRTLLTRPA